MSRCNGSLPHRQLRNGRKEFTAAQAVLLTKIQERWLLSVLSVPSRTMLQKMQFWSSARSEHLEDLLNRSLHFFSLDRIVAAMYASSAMDAANSLGDKPGGRTVPMNSGLLSNVWDSACFVLVTAGSFAVGSTSSSASLPEEGTFETVRCRYGV